MVGHGGSSAGSYLADTTSPIPSHCASIVATSTIRVNMNLKLRLSVLSLEYRYAAMTADRGQLRWGNEQQEKKRKQEQSKQKEQLQPSVFLLYALLHLGNRSLGKRV